MVITLDKLKKLLRCKAAPACRSRAWVSGTGYGSGERRSDGQVWDSKQAASAQAAQVGSASALALLLRHALCALPVRASWVLWGRLADGALLGGCV